MKAPIVLAVDTPDLEIAKQWIAATQDSVSVYKLGLEFFLTFGHAGVKAIQSETDADIPSQNEETGEKGESLSENKNSEVRVSGSLEKHYSPNAQVVLDVQATSGQGFIAPADIATPPGAIGFFIVGIGSAVASLRFVLQLNASKPQSRRI